MGKSQRTKGATYEREVCTFLTDTLGQKVTRNIGQSRDGGDDITLKPWRLECKRRAKIVVYEWWEQVKRAANDCDKTAVIMRGDGKESLVLISLPEFVRLIREDLAEVANEQS